MILEKNHFKREQFKGSWAGAFGQTQFMPSTFLNHAIDFDGDSKINLFNKSDALASGANYLRKLDGIIHYNGENLLIYRD